MLFARIKSRLGADVSRSVVRSNRRKYSVPATSQNEVEPREEPQYPQILDLSYEARHRRTREEWADAVRKTKTVEAKMMKINMPRYYGWRSVMLREGNYPYNCTEQMQYYTRTHVVGEPGLPSYYNDVLTPEKLQSTVENLKGSIEEALVFEYNGRNWMKELDKTIANQPKHVKNVISNSICKQVHRSVVNQLGAEKTHLLETEIDQNPRIEAFWFVGGIPPPRLIVGRRAKIFMPKSMQNDPVDRPMQYLGTPNFQLRHCLPLPEIIPMSESENSDMVVPQFKYQPGVTGLSLERRHGTNIPGFWPGDSSEFGFLSYHSSGYIAGRRPDFDDANDVVKVQAILGSWGWLHSQACNLGFSTFNDVTYPLTNQMIITNGKWWTFCVYQLNTTIVHSKHIDENPRRNICWITEPMRLFEKIEDNRVYGLNSEVIENLVKFYANEPRKREGVNLKPYLQGPHYAAGLKGLENKAWLEREFKHLVANRPRHRRLPEIYNWQQIYVIRHKTRPMDKKREPWEFGIDMWHRKLDDHCPKYIPKAQRKNGLKWERMYYP